MATLEQLLTWESNTAIVKNLMAVTMIPLKSFLPWEFEKISSNKAYWHFFL